MEDIVRILEMTPVEARMELYGMYDHGAAPPMSNDAIALAMSNEEWTGYEPPVDSIIDGCKDVLHFDDMPILWTGLNANGVRIVGSIMEEQPNGDTRCLHAICGGECWESFAGREISYLDLLRGAHILWILTYNIQERLIAVRSTRFEEIAPEYLPLENSFCP